MSQDEIHSMAHADTPPNVDMPKTWPALIVWAVARFGTGILVAAAFAYATHRVYEDNRADQNTWIQAHKEVSKVLDEVADSLRANTDALEKNTREIEDAHRRASP